MQICTRVGFLLPQIRSHYRGFHQKYLELLHLAEDLSIIFEAVVSRQEIWLFSEDLITLRTLDYSWNM